MAAPETVVRAYLAAADERVPGLITGVYGYGSLVLDDWQPAHSDLDLLVVTSRPASAADLDALTAVHAGMPAAPPLEALYLPESWLELPVLPDDQRATPFWLDGVLHRDEECGLLTPVMWLQVTRHARIFRGTPLRVGVDPDRVRDYNLGNLRSYWQREAGWPRNLLGDADPALELAADPVVWLVLGPPRLHYTLATGDVTSKSGAGAHAAQQFPEFAGLAQRAVASRRGEPVIFTAADALAAARLTEAVIEDAWHRWG